MYYLEIFSIYKYIELKITTQDHFISYTLYSTKQASGWSFSYLPILQEYLY